MKIEIISIGVIHSPYKSKEACPIQSFVKPEGAGRIELFKEYEPGLETIETFSHLMVFYVFDRAGEVKLVRPTFLDDAEHGIFASRHPCRPNGIGISIVELVSREHNILFVKGLDMLDQTPLIDIKPYIPRFDLYPDASNGWTDSKELRPKPPGRE